MALLSILRTCLGLHKKGTDEPRIRIIPVRAISESAQILPLMDCLDAKNRVGLAREVLESIRPDEESGATPDPDAILALSGILSDSVNAQTIQGKPCKTTRLLVEPLHQI